MTWSIVLLFKSSLHCCISLTSMASCQSLSPRSYLMVTMTWRGASMSLRRFWQLFTKPSLNTMFTLRELCSSLIWWLLAIPALTNTPPRRLPWLLSLPCVVLCPLLFLVSHAYTYVKILPGFDVRDSCIFQLPTPLKTVTTISLNSLSLIIYTLYSIQYVYYILH